MRPIAQALGATPAMLDDCVIYGRTVMAFNIAFMLQNVFQTFLTTAEKPKLGLVVIIIAGVTKFLPLTGITLPFISYGGSSMVSGFLLLGMLISLSKEQKYG